MSEDIKKTSGVYLVLDDIVHIKIVMSLVKY